MKIACATVSLFFIVFIVTPASAEEVMFTCEITGSGDDGFSIIAVNQGPEPKTCSATCTLTKSDGSRQSWSYSSRHVKAVSHRQWFGGETAVPGAPLSNPQISDTSCN